MSCGCSFPDYIVKCTDTLKVNALLIPGTVYKWVITDKFDKEYYGHQLSDADGHVSIPVADLPPGLLTEYSGEFKLQFFLDECTAVDFKMTKKYDSIDFRVKGGTNIKDNLGCEFDLIDAGGVYG